MQVALTVDAEHPDNRNCSAGNPSRLVDLLHDRGAPASSFIQGRWALANPDLLTRIAGDGHLLGNHSHFHTRLPQLTAAGLRADVGDAAAAITAITGVDTRPWFRCPFGDGGRNRRVLRRLRALGYWSIGWDVEGADWLPERDGDQVAATIIDRLRDRERAGQRASVVLLHTWPDSTAAALSQVIDAARARSWPLVTVASVFGSPPDGHRCETAPRTLDERVRRKLARLRAGHPPAIPADPGAAA